METESLNLLIASGAGLLGGTLSAVIGSVSARRNLKDTLDSEHRRWVRESHRSQRQGEHASKQAVYTELVTEFRTMQTKIGIGRFEKTPRFDTPAFSATYRSIERILTSLYIMSGTEVIHEAALELHGTAAELAKTVGLAVEADEDIDAATYASVNETFTDQFYALSKLMQQDLERVAQLVE